MGTLERLAAVTDAGLFSAAAATTAGVSSAELTRLLRAGAVARLARGVYSLGRCDLPSPAATALTLRGRLSHCTAAAAYGVSLPRAPGHLDVTVDRNRGRTKRSIPGVQLHRADCGESLMVGGVPVTTPVRTCLDISRHLPLEEAVAVADGFCRKRLLRASELADASVALPRAPGRRAAVAVARLVDPAAGSVLESIGRVRMVQAGLPSPTTQLLVYDRAGNFIGRVDFAWEEFRLILEVDGWEWHGDRKTFVADRRRWRALVRAGWTVLVASYDDVMFEMPELVECLGDVLRSSGWEAPIG